MQVVGVDGKGRKKKGEREREKGGTASLLQAPKQLDAAFIKLKYLYILNRQQEKERQQRTQRPQQEQQLQLLQQQQ